MSIRNAILRCLSKVTTPLPNRGGVGGGAILLLLLLVSCQQQEDFKPETATDEVKTGNIILTLGGDDIYLDVETRATATLTDINGFIFTITGTTEMGETITNQTVTLERVGTTNTFIGTVEAGTYTLTADNYNDAAAGNGKPYYSGSSDDFTVAEATTVSVDIALGRPKNACVTYVLDNTYSALYNNPTVNITTLDGDIISLTTLTTTATTSNAAYCHVSSSPATTTLYTNSTNTELNYTLTASAKTNSHVTDISTSGTITVTSGQHTVITLTANTVTGEIIPISNNEHTGEFD